MNIGIVIKKEIIKPDTLLLIKSLNLTNNIVFYGNEGEFNLLTGYDFSRAFFSHIPPPSRNFNNLLFKFIFQYFGFLPKSINNYVVVSAFTIGSIKNSFKRFIVTHIKFRLSLFLPKFFSYDSFLQKIKINDFDLDHNLDAVLFFTQIQDDELLSFFIKRKIPVYIYLYSWDHACKLKRLPRNNVTYFVWTNSIANDLSSLNRVDLKKIFTIGATQFHFIKQLPKLSDCEIKLSDRVIYFCFSTLHNALIAQEIAFLKFLNELIIQYDLNFTVYARLYPGSLDSYNYKEITSLKNVTVEIPDFHNSHNGDSKNLLYNRINNSFALFHFGTTLGLEASFLDTPVFLINFFDFVPKRYKKSIFYLRKFVYQYQNEKYLIIPNSPNVVSSVDQFISILLQLDNLGLKSYFSEYNKFVRNQFNLFEIDYISDKIIHHIKYHE